MIWEHKTLMRKNIRVLENYCLGCDIPVPAFYFPLHERKKIMVYRLLKRSEEYVKKSGGTSLVEG